MVGIYIIIIFIIVFIIVFCTVTERFVSFQKTPNLCPEYWMKQLYPVIKDKTLLDLSLPGSHDTLTFDLSHTVSYGGLKNTRLSQILNYLTSLGISFSDELRTLSITQNLDLPSQASAGIRLFDFRIEYSSNEWRGVHFVQTNHSIKRYLRPLRKWIDDHPNEIFVFWISRHGMGDHSFELSQEILDEGWNIFLDIFGDLIVPTDKYPIDSTSVGKLVSENKRIYCVTIEWEKFTRSSNLAYSNTAVQNNAKMKPYSIAQNREYMTNALTGERKYNKFWSESGASSMTLEFIEDIIFYKYLGWGLQKDHLLNSCLANMDPVLKEKGGKLCPEWLQELSQLINYYNQKVYVQANVFPNCIMLDSVTPSGGVRIGSVPLDVNISKNGNIEKYGEFDFFTWMMAGNMMNLGMHQEASYLLNKVHVHMWEDKDNSRFVM